jgi:hypothetical protein
LKEAGKRRFLKKARKNFRYLGGGPEQPRQVVLFSKLS